MHVVQRAKYSVCWLCENRQLYLWDVVFGFPLDLQKKLLHFTAGSDRVLSGMADLNFKISKNKLSLTGYVWPIPASINFPFPPTKAKSI